MAHFDHFLAKSQLESIRNSLIQSVDLDPAQVTALANGESGIELPEVVVNAPPEESATPTEAEHHPLSSSGNIRSSNGFFSVLRNSMGLTSFGLSSSMNKSPPRFNLRQTINRSYTYNPDNITEKKDFLINLAKSLHIFGSPVHRTEYNMAHSCKALGVSGMFAVLPSMIIVTFGDMDRDPSKSESHILRVDQGLQCEKLNLVEGLTDDLISRKITYSEAAVDLAAILIRPPRYNWKIKALCLGVSSGCIAPLFFGGYLWEAVACFILGCTIGLLSFLAEKHALMSRMFEALASLVVSFLARLFKAYWYTDVCFYPMMLASVVWLLPGLSLTIAITELATRNIISGTTRMFYCFLVCIQLGFGIAIGSRLVFWEDAVPSQETCNTVPGWSNVILFFGTALPFNILLDASPRQWIPMTIAAGIGYGASYGFSFIFASDLNSAISAFCVGLFGGFWAHFDHHPPLITVISGIIMLVPGSMGVRGVTAFFEKDVVSGINFGFNMIVIALSISIGLFFSNMIAFPKKVLTPDSLLF